MQRTLAAILRKTPAYGCRKTAMSSHILHHFVSHRSSADALAGVRKSGDSRSYARARMARRIPPVKKLPESESESESELRPCESEKVAGEAEDGDNGNEDSELDDIYIYHKDMNPFGDEDEIDDDGDEEEKDGR